MVCGYKEQVNVDPEATFTAAIWGIRVYKRTSAGVETEITPGVPIAKVSRSTGSGLQSATWLCPETTLAATDTIVVRVWGGVVESGADIWVGVMGTWQTGQLGTTLLNVATWTVYYYTWLSITGVPVKTWTLRFYYDTATYNSRITNFTWGEAPTPAVGQLIGDGLVWIVS